ncbi:MAG: hypothetical protein R3186_06000 [Ruegeria sp.]|nr:hypothetical protein [Ruegeria sp.]
MTAIRFMDATQNDAEAIVDCISAAYAKARETIDDLPDVTAGIDQMSVFCRGRSARDFLGEHGFVRRRKCE